MLDKTLSIAADLPLSQRRFPMADDDAPESLDVTLAKRLQWIHSKHVNGEPTKWSAVAREDRMLWLKMARTALKLTIAQQVDATAEPQQGSSTPPKPDLHVVASPGTTTSPASSVQTAPTTPASPAEPARPKSKKKPWTF